MTNQPLTPEDEELFELCKEVYKRFPDWKDTTDIWAKETGKPWRAVAMNYTYSRRIPLYTSDHLLDKLPKFVTVKVTRLHKESGCLDCSCERDYKAYLEIHRSDEKTMVCYVSTLNSRAINYLERSSTTLKALLKLVIALHDAGEFSPSNPQKGK